MTYEFRFPNITGATTQEQMVQMRSYMHQLVEQLNWAMSNIDHVQTQVVNNVNRTINESANKEDPDIEVTFSALKPLIIKSAEIVQAYYEEMNTRFVGEYVAVSDFGTFIEQTDQKISQTSTGIEQTFTNIQSIETDIERSFSDIQNAEKDIADLNTTIAEVKAHIRTGLLDDKVVPPVYGIEIGQSNTVDGEKTFNKYARFTSDRLSFYDQNDIEVAYVSDYKLFIRNVEITSSYKIGGFKDTVMANGDVVTKWEGGNG